MVPEDRWSGKLMALCRRYQLPMKLRPLLLPQLAYSYDEMLLFSMEDPRAGDGDRVLWSKEWSTKRLGLSTNVLLLLGWNSMLAVAGWLMWRRQRR